MFTSVERRAGSQDDHQLTSMATGWLIDDEAFRAAVLESVSAGDRLHNGAGAETEIRPDPPDPPSAHPSGKRGRGERRRGGGWSRSVPNNKRYEATFTLARGRETSAKVAASGVGVGVGGLCTHPSPCRWFWFGTD
jgi:hypothetical protein